MKSFIIFLFALIGYQSLFAVQEGIKVYPLENSGTIDVRRISISDIQYQNGKYYFLNFNRGIDIFDGNKWERIDIDSFPQLIYGNNLRAFSIAQDKYYLGTDSGLLVLSNEDTTLYNTTNTDMLDHKIYNLIKYDEGIIFNTNHVNPVKFENNEIHVFPFFEDNLPPVNFNYGQFMVVDSDRNFWYTSGRVLVKHNENETLTWDSTNSPLRYLESIKSLTYSENEKKLLISTRHEDNTHFYEFSEGVFTEKEFISQNIPVEYQIHKVFLDKNQNLYLIFFDISHGRVTTEFAKVNKDYTEIKFYDVNKMLDKEFVPINTLFLDDFGKLWIGTTQDGIIEIDIDKVISVDDTESSLIPDIWIRYCTPNPISSTAKINFYIEPSLVKNCSVAIYNLLGAKIKDITHLINYDPSINTAFINFEKGNIYSGLYYLNVRSGNESRTLPIVIE